MIHLHVTYYLIWLGLFVISVSDAREHRIPNYMLLFVLCLSLIDKSLSATPMPLLFAALAGAGVMFICSFVLYCIRAMAPGDVKLLGVVGFIIGWGQLLDAAYWIGIATVVVGVFYALIRLAERPESAKLTLTKYSLIASGAGAIDKGSSDKQLADKLRMPFAPIVTIGLALQQYF